MDWDTKATGVPIADLRRFIAYARAHSTPFDHVEIDLARHPVHLLSADFVANVTRAVEARGYRVTSEAHPDGGWIVDWEAE